MKTIHSIKFIFTEEEIAHVRAVWEMLKDMDDYDYDELCEQVEDGSTCDFHEFYEYLDDLLIFMEDHVDLQDN